MKHVNIIFLICCSSLGLIYLSSCEKIKPISWNLGLNNTKFGDTMVGKKMMGGEIAYIYTPQDPGYSPTKLHGIIVADKDFGPYPWMKCILNIELGKEIGLGLLNSNKIASLCADSTAARECLNLTYKNYSDWVLPSLLEMTKVYEYMRNERNINLWNGNDNTYWTSSASNWSALAFGISGEKQVGSFTNSIYKVRPIRYF